MASQLGQLLLTCEQQYQQCNALHVGGVDYTYAELMARARLLASAMIDAAEHHHGAVNTVLAIDKSVDGFSAIIATQLAEQTWVPLSPSFPTARNARIIEQAKPQVLLLGPAYRAQAEALVSQCGAQCRVIFVGWQQLDAWVDHLAPERYVALESDELEKAMQAPSAPTLPAVSRPCELAYIMFTSGSTGLPKGVSVTQTNVMAYLKRIEALYQPSSEDRFSQFFEFTFDLSVHDLFVCWQAGGCLYPAGLADNLMPTAYVRRHQLTYWFSVPTMAASLENLGQLKAQSMPSLKHVLFCGEALPNKVVKGFQRAANQALIDNLYGPTEATIAFTIKRFDTPMMEDDGIAGIGRAFDGLSVVVVDEHNRACQCDQKGELLLGGDQLADGYWQRDDLTDMVFVTLDVDGQGIKRWYRSGDLACLDEHGEITFFGRVDNQIKIRGYRIELQEVEQLIAKATGVSHVAAIAVYAEGVERQSAQSISAFVVADKTTDELLRLCKANLPAYMVPEHIEVMAQLPTNASGKVDRNQLKNLVKS